jgi:FtsP/CotA-like multicopper oxidase with cupredoxin domain
MRETRLARGLLAALALAALLPAGAGAAIKSQCPATVTDPATGATDVPGVYCKHLSASDGFAAMGDGNVLYTFGFRDVTGIPDAMVVDAGMLGAQMSAPTLTFPEGAQVYLTLSNVGMLMRPDLFDPHSVHFHGYPNASAVFDGEPMSTISINMGSSLTYFYQAPSPGTYMYHCHVEATEHMQMGMLGNLYITPAQDGTPLGTCGGGPCTQFAYNDGDGSTGYDVAVPIQISGFDRDFHELHLAVQPLPFALMVDTYPMLNGRGYPDTVNPAPLAAPVENGGKVAQPLPALITAPQGQRILLRISSLSTVEYFTVGLGGLTMRVVGKDARHLRGPGGDRTYVTNSVTLGGGQSVDAIIDTTGVAPGRYFLYAKNLDHLSNDTEDFGGMMTEVVITP